MSKPRKEYAYVAQRIGPGNSRNLGDFEIRRQLPPNEQGKSWCETYHYASEDYDGPHGAYRWGLIVHRRTFTHIDRGSHIYNECISAVERLLKEEQESA